MNTRSARRQAASLILSALAGTTWGGEGAYDLGEVLVTATKLNTLPLGAMDVDTDSLASLRPATSDTASLLRDIPGVSLYGAGGVSGLPAIHGLADDRLRVKVDGMDLIAACPNHMNAPLSYIDPSDAARARVYAGITPVSVGGDSIGGTILVESGESQFAQPGAGTLTTGEVGTFYRSNGNARGAHARVTLAGENLSLTYTGSTVQSQNYTAAGDFKTTTATGRPGHTLPLDEVGSTAYKSINQSLDVAWRNDHHQFDLRYGHQHIPYEGFPNQRMDMTRNDSDLVNLGYLGRYRWGKLEARVYRQSTNHEMQFGDDKQYTYGDAPGMPMNTSANDTGAQVKADITLSESDVLRIGSEYQHYTLDDWWPPSGTGGMSPGVFQNINDGRRDRYALFGEWESHLGSRWTGLLGLRHETVEMDAGDVHGYCTGGMCMGNQIRDSGAFNGRGHGKTDRNWDLTALSRYTPDATHSYEFGLARKSRSPNLYQRYAWSTWPMAAVMNNFVGDGNGYVGNPGLKPEVAYTVSATADWHDADRARWGLKVTPYYTYVRNFIDARCLPGTTCPADQFNVLQYVNQSARLYGIDLSGHMPLADTRGYGRFTATGVLNYAKGENRTTGDGLYNIMPLNARLALVQRLGRWTNTVEARLVAGKHDVSKVRNEVETGGYSLFDLRTSYAWKRVRLDAGIENLFDRLYSLPLGGVYLGQGTTMSVNGVPWGVAVPGMGRSVYAGLTYRF